MEKNKDPLCKCNNRQVIPSKERKSLLGTESSSAPAVLSHLLGEDIWGKARTQIFTKHPVFSSAQCLNQLWLSCSALYQTSCKCAAQPWMQRGPTAVGMRTGGVWAAAQGEAASPPLPAERGCSSNCWVLWLSPHHFNSWLYGFLKGLQKSHTLSWQMASLFQDL